MWSLDNHSLALNAWPSLSSIIISSDLSSIVSLIIISSDLYSIISLIIFILLLLSNHKKLKENSDKCIDGKVVPNYPLESYGIVIKIVAIFKDFIIALSMRKMRGKR